MYFKIVQDLFPISTCICRVYMLLSRLCLPCKCLRQLLPTFCRYLRFSFFFSFFFFCRYLSSSAGSDISLFNKRAAWLGVLFLIWVCGIAGLAFYVCTLEMESLFHTCWVKFLWIVKAQFEFIWMCIPFWNLIIYFFF